ncbi:HAD family hydrolase [Streptomyces avicenniae]|uniref:HAD family hydrolase n=1 Tax=Streptomyces avicenniae TaxID=500153 RepID=UPI000A816D74|nr:HAD-IA family hydrolase [Streptomyces avicenniae]
MPDAAAEAVLFDFSGTLMRVEPAVSWLGAALGRVGVTLPGAEAERLAGALEEAGALPGGQAPGALPPALAELWAERDRDADRHRATYTALARRVPLPVPELYDALYDRHMEPEAWRPYADAADVLRALRERGVPVAVVSNIGWDLRPVFRAHGLDTLVDAYVLSFEHGVQKPAPRIFALACAALGVAPGRTLMVGDDRRADGGAEALGCAVRLVEHLPVERRPDGLRPVLSLVRGTRGGGR